MLICDRGALDPSAYMARDEWLTMLKEMNLDELEIRERYDCVVHLVTAAKGATSFYSLENNDTRTEDTPLACQIDSAIMNAWVGHTSLITIDNETINNFHEKCDKVVQAISTRLGLQTQSRMGKLVVKKKFLVKNFELSKAFPVSYREFNVERNFV